MKNIKRTLIALILSGAAVISLAGCNFFSWATPPVPGMSSQEFTARGESYFHEKNYAESVINFENALSVDSRNSRARLGYARSKLWLSFPDLILMITKKMETVPNAIEAVILTLNSQEGRDYLSRIHNMDDFLDIVNVIDSPNGILNDMGDKVITSENMEANQYLLVCYMSLFFIHFLDSNKDGNFGTPPDYCVLSNGTLAFSIEMSGKISNIMAATNITNGMSQTDAMTIMAGAHQSAEELMDFCSFIYLNLDYALLSLQTIVRPSGFLKQLNTNNIYPKGKPYVNYYEEFRDAVTNTNADSSITPLVKEIFWFRKFPDFVGVEMNAMHEVIVGSAGYIGNIGNYRFTAWDTHTGGLKADILLSGPVINGSTANAIITAVTNSMTSGDVDDMLNM